MKRFLILLLVLALSLSLCVLPAAAAEEDDDVLSDLTALATQLWDKGRDALSELSERWRERDNKELADSLRDFLTKTEAMTDEELTAEIRRFGEDHGIRFTDDQCAQLVSLCRRVQKLDDGQLEEKIEDIKNLFQKLGDLGEKADGVKDTAVSVFGVLKNLWSRFTAFLSGLFQA